MGNIAIVNAVGLSPYALKRLPDGGVCIDKALAFASDLPDMERIVVFTSEETTNELEIQGGTVSETKPPVTELRKKEWNTAVLFLTMEEEAQGFEHIFYFYGDCPLLDIDLSKKMYQNHLRYFTQYTFADGFPYGLAPEIIKTDAVEALALLAKGDAGPIKRDTVFSVIQKDINSFDLETEISPRDVRLLRLELCCDTKRNYMLTSRVMENGGTASDSVLTAVEDKPEILRTIPSFYNIQIVDGCPQTCSYCPYPLFGGDILNRRGEMPVEKFASICESIHRFSEDAVVSLSLWGEPSFHSDIVSLVEKVAERKTLSLIIETTGIGWKAETLSEIRDKAPRAIDWIVSLDADDPRLYRELRGEGQEEALQTAELLFTLFPNHVYLQAVRMQRNEENLETFYRKWKERTDTIIIQKYDHFAGFLPQRKVTDLSPIKRFPCRHNQRDMVIRMDGTVPLCREDVNNKYVLGNIFNDDIEQLWNRGESVFKEHIREQYNDLCVRCDEYYTFNF